MRYVIKGCNLYGALALCTIVGVGLPARVMP